MFIIILFLVLIQIQGINNCIMHTILKIMQTLKIKLLILFNKVLFEGVVTKLFFSTYRAFFGGVSFLKLYKTINKVQLIT